MDKLGQSQPFFLFMIGVIILLLTFALAGSLTKTMKDTMTNLNCASATTTSQKINCSVTDMVAPFFLALLIGLGIVALTSKLIGG